MIQIEISRWTIKKLEEALTKHNEKKESYILDSYADILNEVLREYLEQ